MLFRSFRQYSLLVFILLSFVIGLPSAFATDGTWTQTANTVYSNPANWTNSTVAGGTGATMSVTKSGPTIMVDTNVTLGTLSGAWNSSSSMNLSGSSGASLNFASSGTPLLSTATFYSRNDYIANLNIAGTQGLSIKTASNDLTLQSGVTWTGFSGALTIVANNNDGGILYAQGNNVLPPVDLTMNPGNETNGYGNSKLILGGSTSQTIGALNSVATANNTAYIFSYAGSGTVGSAGTPTGTNAVGLATLMIGATNGNGNFAGIIGAAYNNSSNAVDTSATVANLAIVKTGSGTQVLGGLLAYTVSAGAWIVNGTAAAVSISGSDAGAYLVSAGAILGGTGTIRPGSTSGSTAMIAISGTLAPGYGGVGTLTLDGAGRITAGLSIGAGLANYPGSTLKRAGTDIVLNLAPASVAGTPTGVGVSVSGTQVTVSWSASANATSYIVYRGTSPNGTYSAVATTSSLSFLDASVANGKTYYYKVAAFNGAVESPASGALAGTPLDPATLSIVSVNIRPCNSFGISGTESAGVTRVAWWNNLVGPCYQGQTATLSNLTDHLGAPIADLSVSMTAGSTTTGVYDFSGTLLLGAESTGGNDTNVFATAFDQYNGTPSTLTVSGVPYSSYDVLFYLYDDGSSRGGAIALNGVTYYARGGAGTPAISGTGYVQSDDTTLNAGHGCDAGELCPV